MRTALSVILVLFTLLGTSTARAFEPGAGQRAYPIAGHDIISGKYYDLEAYRGKWVFLEFWASW